MSAMASSRSSDECFRCHQLGHWAQDCKNNVPEERPHFSLLDDIFPEKMCNCGRGPCMIRTSNSQRNPGRKYYKCCKCGFFEWCDGLGFSSSQPLSSNSPLRNPNPNPEGGNLNPNPEGGDPAFNVYTFLRNLILDSNSPLWNSNPNPSSLSWNRSSSLNSPSWDNNPNSNPNSNPNFPSQNPNPNPVSPSRGPSPNFPSWGPNLNSSSDPNPLSPSQNHNSNRSPHGEFAWQQQFSSPSNNDKIGSTVRNDVSSIECPCRAGPCPVRTTRNGKNTGRKYVACPIKKGEGSCGFFEWRD